MGMYRKGYGSSLRKKPVNWSQQYGGIMSKPYEHAILSAKKWGGTAEDYLPIHDFMDSSKAHVADMRHRAILHSSFGIYLAERVFGTNLIVEYEDVTIPPPFPIKARNVSVRDVAEQHVIQDVGFIPSVQQYLDHMELVEWMGGKKKKSFTILLKAEAKLEGQDCLTPEQFEELSKHWKETTLDHRSTSCYTGLKGE
jgi:hypothetical protein